jgi:hypothetical protein
MIIELMIKSFDVISQAIVLGKGKTYHENIP